MSASTFSIQPDYEEELDFAALGRLPSGFFEIESSDTVAGPVVADHAALQLGSEDDANCSGWKPGLDVGGFISRLQGRSIYTTCFKHNHEISVESSP